MKALAEQINELDGIEIYGRVVGVRGLMVEVAGPLHAMSVGARVVIETPAKSIPSEVIGFSGPYALLMPFAPLEGVRRRLPRACDIGRRCGAAIARSVVVVSTSDEPALMRRQAAHVTLA